MSQIQQRLGLLVSARAEKERKGSHEIAGELGIEREEYLAFLAGCYDLVSEEAARALIAWATGAPAPTDDALFDAVEPEMYDVPTAKDLIHAVRLNVQTKVEKP